MSHHAPIALVGKGFVFFNTQLVGLIDRLEFGAAFPLVKGRHLGKVKNVAFGDEDVTVLTHFSGYREEANRILLNKRAAARNTMETTPAAGSSSNFNHGERKTLLASDVAVTLSQTPLANTLEVVKRDFSTWYTKTTDYTLSSAEVTRVGGGSIDSAQEVLCLYEFADASAHHLKIGKGVGPLISELDISFVNNADGKLWQYSCTKASPDGESRIVIEKAGPWPGMDCSWTIISDEDQEDEYGRISISSVTFPSL